MEDVFIGFHCSRAGLRHGGRHGYQPGFPAARIRLRNRLQIGVCRPEGDRRKIHFGNRFHLLCALIWCLLKICVEQGVVFQRDPASVKTVESFIDADGLPHPGTRLKMGDPYYWLVATFYRDFVPEQFSYGKS